MMLISLWLTECYAGDSLWYHCEFPFQYVETGVGDNQYNACIKRREFFNEAYWCPTRNYIEYNDVYSFGGVCSDNCPLAGGN